MNEFLTVHELARCLKVTVAAIRKWQAKGLPRIPLGKRLVRFQLPEVLRWLAEQSQMKQASTEAL
jgi:hypothetical protein